ncbi:BZ3500_MvSof-1268-A1-R1_Chr9g10308 [Microbotryum saponariae]|uniref:BZ3500_MvSof-1268-A1-R1_Chr9g10308 protein n=1 Tax=Microbotryum saponariae TaxID=289078 RepID=A0A2X0L5Z6_9BASI|nr:BZ3501_MvSof-1269-A2-R1_Chr9g10058 [Microbotryum saponariae]SCZ99888.1 BZ3500_MvSof-1268-A1-R1_Chr9g10308 [Microbotryum saponariae]
MNQPDSGPPVELQGPSNGSSSAMPCQSGPNVLHPPTVTGPVVPQHPYNAYVNQPVAYHYSHQPHLFPTPPRAFGPLYHLMPHYQPMSHHPPSHPANSHT